MRTDKYELAEKIKKIQGVVPHGGSMGILQGILAADGYLTANDTITAVRTPVDGMEPGERFIIPQRAFSLISSLPECDVDIAAEGQTIRIKAEKVNVRLNTPDPMAFPLPTAMSEDSGKVTVDGRGFLRALKRVLVAVSDGEANPVMEAMHMKAADGMMDLVGIDGARAAWESIPCEGETEMLIPKSAVANLKGLNPDGTLTIKHDPHGAMFETGDFAMTTRLANGKLFDYERMYSAKRWSATVDRKDLLSAAGRAMICGTGKTPLLMEVGQDRITVSVEDERTGYVEDIEAALSPEAKGAVPMTIGLGSKLVADALKALDDDTVRLQMTNGKAPVVIEGDACTCRFMIAPVVISPAGRKGR